MHFLTSLHQFVLQDCNQWWTGGGDPWAFSTKENPGSSEVLIGGRRERHSPIFLKLRESSSKDDHAAREMVTVYSVTLLLVTVYCYY